MKISKKNKYESYSKKLKYGFVPCVLAASMILQTSSLNALANDVAVQKTEEKANQNTPIPALDAEKAKVVENAALYKEDYKDEEDKDDWVANCDDYWNKKVSYVEENDKTTYEIIFNKSYLDQSTNEKIVFTDKVMVKDGDKTFEAYKEQNEKGELVVRFTLAGKLKKEIPLVIHSIKQNHDYSVLLQVRDTTKEENNQEGQTNFPEFDDEKSQDIENAALYKKDYDPADDEEDKEDICNDFWDKEVLYQEFEDRNSTVYEIGFSNNYKKANGEYMVYTDEVTAVVDGKEYKAVAIQRGADVHFKFEIPGKVRKEIPLKIHALPNKDNPDYAYRNVLLQVRDTTVKETPKKEEENKIKDGIYDVKVDLKNYYEDKASMGNKAINSDAKIIVKDNKATIELSVKPIEFMNTFGGLTNLFKLEGSYNYKDKSNRTEAEKKDKKKFKNEKAKVEKEYFTKFSMEVPLSAVNEKAEIPVVVWVDAMDHLNGGKPGAGEQPATLRIFGKNTEFKTFEQTEGIPGKPDVPEAVEIAPLTNPKTVYAMAERYQDSGVPSMANTTLDKEVKVQKVGDKTRYEVKFKEFVDKEYNINEPMVSVGQLWYKDSDGKIKEAYLAKKEGNDRTYRFEISGDMKDEVELTVLVVPMQKLLGDGAAIQKANLVLSNKKIVGDIIDERYERTPYDIKIQEDKNLEKGSFYVKQEGKTGIKKVYRTYEAINGVSTGKLLKTKEEKFKDSTDKIIVVNNKKDYEEAIKEIAKRVKVENGQNLQAKFAVADKKEVEFEENPFFTSYVNVKEDNGEKIYTVKFAPKTMFLPSVYKLYLIKNGQQIEAQSLGTIEKQSSDGTKWKENADHSTAFTFKVKGDIQNEILTRILYSGNLKSDSILLINPKEVKFGAEVFSKTEKIPYKTIRKEDKNLPKGKEVVVQEGQEGVKTVNSYYKTVDGIVSADKEKIYEEETVLKNEKDRIVTYGTFDINNTSETPDVTPTPTPDVTPTPTPAPEVKSGWGKDEVGYKYQRANGSFAKNEWEPVNGTWYHFDEKGYMQTGWLNLDGTWYYLNADGSMAKDTWIGTYYVDESGAWVVEGWQQSGYGWWYQRANGTYPHSEWEIINGIWYHFDENGYMQTGWLNSDGTWYYLNADGSMATDTYVDGYYVDANGAWIN